MSDVDNSDEGTEIQEDGLEPFRGSPVGTNDPNIVGDIGPYDVPPGQDPDPRDDNEAEAEDEA